MLDYCESCLTRLRELDGAGRSDTELAVSVAQAAETAAAGLWGLDPARLDPAVRERGDGLPDRIAGAAAKIAAARSGPHLEAARVALTRARTAAPPARDDAGPLTERIEHVTRQFEIARDRLSRVTDDGMTDAAGAVLAGFADLLAEVRRERVDAYNSWAVQRVRRAYYDLEYEQGSWNEGNVSERDARKVFIGKGRGKEEDNRGHLAEVDQTLLTPEVARIYNDVVGQLVAEMSPGAVVASETEMADPDWKRHLDEF